MLLELTIIIVSVLISVFFIYKYICTNDIIYFFPSFYMFILLYSFLGVTFLSYAKKVPFDLFNDIKTESLVIASWPFIVAAISFYIGTIGTSNNKINHNSKKVNIKYQKSIMIFIIITLSIFIIGYGIEPLLSRSGYIDRSFERNMIMLKIFFIISPFAFTLIPFVNNKYIRYTIVISILLMLFSSSSRTVILVPLFYMFGCYLKYSKITIYQLLFNVVIIYLLLVITLQIRNNQVQGLLPNLFYLINNGVNSDYLFLGLNYAVSFSFLGVAYTLQNFTFDLQAFLLSINPLPSSMIDLSYMLDTQKINATSPFPALATLAQAGFFFVFLFFVISGYVFSRALNFLKYRSWLYYVVFGLFILFTIFSVQYNLRGASRFLYYSIILFLTIFVREFFVGKIKFRL